METWWQQWTDAAVKDDIDQPLGWLVTSDGDTDQQEVSHDSTVTFCCPVRPPGLLKSWASDSWTSCAWQQRFLSPAGGESTSREGRRSLSWSHYLLPHSVSPNWISAAKEPAPLITGALSCVKVPAQFISSATVTFSRSAALSFPLASWTCSLWWSEGRLGN